MEPLAVFILAIIAMVVVWKLLVGTIRTLALVAILLVAGALAYGMIG